MTSNFLIADAGEYKSGESSDSAVESEPDSPNKRKPSSSSGGPPRKKHRS